MNFSEYFHVLPSGVKDINLDGDQKLYLSPERFLQVTDPDFDGKDAQLRMQTFMGTIGMLIDDPKDMPRLIELVTVPCEMNETRLGLGTGEPQGSGTSATILIDVLRKNRNITGLEISKYPESFLTFTPSFGPDRFSDLHTNICSADLVRFTQKKCRKYGIPMTKGHAVNYFDPESVSWEVDSNVELPEYKGLAILLVPEELLVKQYQYTADRYVQMEVLEGKKSLYKKHGKKVTKRWLYNEATANIKHDKCKTYAQKEAIQDPVRYLEFLDKERLLNTQKV